MNEKKYLLVDFDMDKEYNTLRTTSSKYFCFFYGIRRFENK